MNNNWNKELMRYNIADKGYPFFEIDESEIIGNQILFSWVFGIFDRITKDCLTYCVLNGHTSNNL